MDELTIFSRWKILTRMQRESGFKKRIFITCDTDIDITPEIEFLMDCIQPGTTLLVREKRGARIIRRLGFARRHKIISYMADNEEYGEEAGIIRNRKIIEEGKIDYGILIHDGEKERGMGNCLQLLIANDIQFMLCDSKCIWTIMKDETQLDIDPRYSSDTYEEKLAKTRVMMALSRDRSRIQRINRSIEVIKGAANIKNRTSKRIAKDIERLRIKSEVDNEVKRSDTPPLEKMKCQSLTKKGTRCSNNASKDSNFCGIRSHKESV
jgi:hypothetical protein